MSALDRVVCAIIGIVGIYAIYLLIFKATNKDLV
ncbi:hypothetical protein AB3M91_11885 [Solibacillus isronensis]|nr:MULTISPECIES: hypothetical protein [Solibacillus]